MSSLVLDVEFARTRWIRGFRSRNKAAVGEPAAGSLLSSIVVSTWLYCININSENKIETSNSGSLGLIIDEERETKRY